MQWIAFRAQLDDVANASLLIGQLVGAIPRVDDVTLKLHLVESVLWRTHDAGDPRLSAVCLWGDWVPDKQNGIDYAWTHTCFGGQYATIY